MKRHQACLDKIFQSKRDNLLSAIITKTSTVCLVSSPR